MKLSVDFGGWTTTKAALAVAGVLAIAGAVGSAIAISPIVTPPIKWGGGFEAGLTQVGTGVHLLAAVPANSNLLVTDLTVSNFGSTATSFNLFRGGASCNEAVGQDRLRFVAVPAQNVTHLSYQTGIGFGAGQLVCAANNAALTFNLRGFLFTAAPAS